MRLSWSVLALAAFVLPACKEKQPTQLSEAIINKPLKADSKPFIAPPIPDLNPQYLTFTLNASKGARFRTPSGSEILVPADALLDDKGQKPTTQWVELRYREMHDAVSIYLAGVSMAHKDSYLSTAGSFDLRCGDEKLHLVKPVKVKMASYTEGADYDFFYLNETDKKWDYLGTRKPEKNLTKIKLLKKAKNKKSTLAFPLNRDYFAFNYLSILDVYNGDDYAFLKSNETIDSALAAISSKLKAYGLGWETTRCNNHKMIQWEGGEYPASLFVWRNVAKKPFPEWSKNQYGSLSKIKDNRYMYRLENNDSTYIDIELEAVMPLKSLFAFSPERWKNQYATTMREVKKEQERVKRMVNLYRTFEVNQFGLYNWDKMMKEEGRVVLDAHFDFHTDINNKLTSLDVIYISGDNKTVITYPKTSWAKMALLPDKKARLFALLPDNTVAIYRPQRYAFLDFTTWRMLQAPQFQFVMEEETAVKTEKDLRKVLGI
jgi:hypothetical protein